MIDLRLIPLNDLIIGFIWHPDRAEELIRRAIYTLEDHNDKCDHKWQKWFITADIIQVLVDIKLSTIERLLVDYQQRLDEHHAVHGLELWNNQNCRPLPTLG